MKKVMHNTDIKHIKSMFNHKFTSVVHNLKINFNKFFNITKLIIRYLYLLYFCFRAERGNQHLNQIHRECYKIGEKEKYDMEMQIILLPSLQRLGDIILVQTQKHLMKTFFDRSREITF